LQYRQIYRQKYHDIFFNITIYRKIQYFFDNTIRYIDIQNDISIFSIYQIITNTHTVVLLFPIAYSNCKYVILRTLGLVELIGLGLESVLVQLHCMDSTKRTD